jgi:ABC-type Na+ transport system ATPase subunit NatA
VIGSSQYPLPAQSNKVNNRKSMPSAGFEPAIPAIKHPQTYALDRAATGIGTSTFFGNNFITQQLKLCRRSEKIFYSVYEAQRVATYCTKIAMLAYVFGM